MDALFHSSDEEFVLPCFSFPFCSVLWRDKLKHKTKLRNLGSMILVFKLNVPALRTFIKGIGCKSNNKRWRSWKEKSRGADLAQNPAWVFSMRTTEMKMTINQMHFLKHQGNASREHHCVQGKWIPHTKISKCPQNQEMSYWNEFVSDSISEVSGNSHVKCKASTPQVIHYWYYLSKYYWDRIFKSPFGIGSALNQSHTNRVIDSHCPCSDSTWIELLCWIPRATPPG